MSFKNVAFFSSKSLISDFAMLLPRRFTKFICFIIESAQSVLISMPPPFSRYNVLSRDITTPLIKAFTIRVYMFPPSLLNSKIIYCTLVFNSWPSRRGRLLSSILTPLHQNCHQIISVLDFSLRYFALQFLTVVAFKLYLSLKWANVCGVECCEAYFPTAALSAGDNIW